MPRIAQEGETVRSQCSTSGRPMPISRVWPRRKPHASSTQGRPPSRSRRREGRRPEPAALRAAVGRGTLGREGPRHDPGRPGRARARLRRGRRPPPRLRRLWRATRRARCRPRGLAARAANPRPITEIFSYRPSPTTSRLHQASAHWSSPPPASCVVVEQGSGGPCRGGLTQRGGVPSSRIRAKDRASLLWPGRLVGGALAKAPRRRSRRARAAGESQEPLAIHSGSDNSCQPPVMCFQGSGLA